MSLALSPLPKDAARRRIFLMRHGSVDYFNSDGNPVRPDNVPLSVKGRFDDQILDVKFEPIADTQLELTPDTQLATEIRGYLVCQLKCKCDRRHELELSYSVFDAYSKLHQGNYEAYYLDIFCKTRRVEVDIHGDNLWLGWLTKVLEVVELKDDFLENTAREHDPSQVKDFVDAPEGDLRWKDGKIHFELSAPTQSYRYKLRFFKKSRTGSPSSSVTGHCDAVATGPCVPIVAAPLSDAARAVQTERYRLVAEYQRGNLDAYLGQFLLAAEGRILDHDPDRLALRRRAAEKARGVPPERLVEYYVPTVD